MSFKIRSVKNESYKQVELTIEKLLRFKIEKR